MLEEHQQFSSGCCHGVDDIDASTAAAADVMVDVEDGGAIQECAARYPHRQAHMSSLPRAVCVPGQAPSRYSPRQDFRELSARYVVRVVSMPSPAPPAWD